MKKWRFLDAKKKKEKINKRMKEERKVNEEIKSLEEKENEDNNRARR